MVELSQICHNYLTGHQEANEMDVCLVKNTEFVSAFIFKWTTSDSEFELYRFNMWQVPRCYAV